MEKDTLSISGPQSTGDLRASPSISQPDLAVPGEPTSEMVEDKWKSDEHAAFDTDINDEFPLTLLELVMNMERPLTAMLSSLLEKIAEQNNHKIHLVTALKMMEQKEYKWLRDFLIAKWRDGSFTEARRLSECPLCTFPVLRATFFFPEILQPPTITPSSSTDAIMSGDGRLSSSTTEMLLMHR